MYITLIIFWIGFLLDGKNIISQTSKFLLLVSYKSVDLIGPTFKLLIEGFLKFIVTFPLSRFMVSGFFGREVGFRGASCIISLRRSLSKKKIKNKFLNESIKVLFLNLEFSFLFFFKASHLWWFYIVIRQSILSAVTFAFGYVIKFNNILSRWITNRILDYRNETLKLSNFGTINNKHLGVSSIFSRKMSTNIHSQFFKLSWEIREHSDPEFVILEKFSQEQLILSRNFIEWFRGFTDSEGTFIIQNDARLAKDYNFKFIFRIGLHIDDKAALEFIKNSLQIGNVRVYHKTSEVIYELSAQSDIEIILAIFTKFKLNTTKHLNFIDFKQAFLLFVENSNQIVRKELKPVIKSIKGNMNKQRTEFSMASDHYNVSSYWLLGYVEGDGSFFFSASNKSLVFTISQKGNEALMRAIEKFLYNLVPLNLKNEKGYDSWVKINSDSRGMFNLIVQRGAYIESVLIPLFDSLSWHSRKYLDYSDWKAIFNIYKKGLNYLTEGETLVTRIIS